MRKMSISIIDGSAYISAMQVGENFTCNVQRYVIWHLKESGQLFKEIRISIHNYLIHDYSVHWRHFSSFMELCRNISAYNTVTILTWIIHLFLMFECFSFFVVGYTCVSLKVTFPLKRIIYYLVECDYTVNMEFSMQSIKPLEKKNCTVFSKAHGNPCV